MNNLLAGTPSGEASDLYPDQRLTTQALHADYGYTSCDVCNLIPQPTWAYGSCQACERYQAPGHSGLHPSPRSLRSPCCAQGGAEL